MNVTLRQLKVFEAVARHLSFTRAAEVLHLSQPAVSMQVKQLEENLGVPLFEQLGRKVYLTQAGEEMARYSRKVTEQLAEAALVMEELKGMQRGRLNIAVASTANYFAPRLLATFCRHREGLEISLEVSNRECLLRYLDQNEKDMVIMGRPPAGQDLAFEAFMDNPLVVIAPPGHPLAGADTVPLERLHQETFLVREQGSGTRIAMERFFRDQGISVTTGMEMSSNEAIKQAVMAGLGLGIVSRHTLDLELETGHLVALPVAGFPIMRHWYVVHRRGKRLSQVAETFKRFVLEEACVLLEDPRPADEVVPRCASGRPVRAA